MRLRRHLYRSRRHRALRRDIAAAGALERLEGFASRHGAQFYGLPVNRDSLTLVAKPWPVAREIAFGPDRLVPFRAGATVAWKLA